MSPEWIAVVVAAGSLVVGLATLVVALLILWSVRRSEQGGEERLELLREQRERLEFLNRERRMLEEELESQHRANPQGPQESPETPVERPEGAEVWLDSTGSGTSAPERSWWRRVFGR